jgi:type IV pilus assembly protein PilM
MATPRFAWGIDIGNRALKAVKLVTTAEGLVIDDFDVIEHENVLSASGDNRESLIQSALAQFVQRHPGIEKGQVGVGVTGQQSFARFIKLPPVDPKEIPKIVRFEAIQQIPFPLDEVEWSYQLFEDPESPDVEVGIFAMRKDLVNQHIKFFTDAKLNVQAVQMNPLSVYNAMYYDSRIKGTTMIIDVGAENTDLIIAEGESIWMRSISIGGNNFTESLTKAFKVNFAKAEDLKRNASTSKYGRQIMQAMRPIFADLVSEIQRSIGFYSSVHKESRISKVIAIGSTFRLPGLQKYLSQNLTLDVEKLDRLGSGASGGAVEDPKIAAMLSENLLSAAGAYGLALQVMGQGKISSSLLPETIRRDKMWAEKTKWFVGAAALFMIGAAVPYGRLYLENNQFNSQESQDNFTRISKVQSDAQKADTDWGTIERAGADTRQILLNARELKDGKHLWPEINTLLYNALPQNVEGAQPELGTGNLDDVKKIKRGDRRQIFILDKVPTYYPDLSPVVKFPETLRSVAESFAPVLPFENGNGGSEGSGMQGGGMPGGVVPSVTGAPVPGLPSKIDRGFVILMKVRTPNSTGDLMFEKYDTTLTSLKPTKEFPYEVKFAKFFDPHPVREDKDAMMAMENAYQQKQRDAEKATVSVPGAVSPGPLGNPGFRPNGYDRQPYSPPYSPLTNGGAADQKIPDEAYLDPVTHEDVRDDTVSKLALVVVIDAAVPVAPPAAAPGAATPPKTVAAARAPAGSP